MADVPKGPGQPETTGALDATRAPNAPGLYFEPKSKTYHHVSRPAGADALARMGMKLVEEGQDLTANMEAALATNNQPKTAADIAADTAPAAPAAPAGDDDKSNKKG